MRILNCFKIIADLEKMTMDDWQVASCLFVDTSFIKTMINESDASAIELSLRLRDCQKSNIYGITISEKKVRSFVKNLYGLKFDEIGVCDSTGIDIRFRPDIVSSIIADYAKNKQVDIIALGSNAPEGNNYLTPFYVAEILGIDCVNNVIDIIGVDDNIVRIKHITDMGIITKDVTLPVVIVVDNAPNTSLRIPTLKDKMEGSKKEIYNISINDYLQNNIDVMKPVKLNNIENSRESKALEKELLSQVVKENLK